VQEYDRKELGGISALVRCSPVPEVPNADLSISSNNDVVEHVNAERRARFFQPGRYQKIVFAGRWIAGWVIVYEDNGLRRVLNRWTEHLARMNQAPVERADAYQMGADHMKLDVQGDNVKFLLDCIVRPSGEVIPAEPDRLDGVRDTDGAALVLRKAHGHSPAQLNAGHDLAIRGFADGCRDLS
jgi:hypothetical protein